jgi:glycosyltransferase involved in cell wall biosynthesis
MRIAYVSADQGVPVFGTNGSSAHVRAVLRAFLARGASIDLFASRFDGRAPADLAMVRVRALPSVPRDMPQARRERLALDANDALREQLEVAGPFDLVYERQSLWSAAGMEQARDWGVPGLLEVNAPLLEETARYRTLVDHEAARRQRRRTFAAASALLAVSPGVARHLAGFAEAAGRVHVVPNGVDPCRFAPGRAERRPGEPVRIGFLGSLRPWHGVDGLIDAVAILFGRGLRVRLLVVGKGPEQERLEARARALGMAEAVEWTGAVPEAAVPGELARMDIAVAPYPASPAFYFSPLKLFEYMAAGLPIVTTNVGDLATIIEHDRTGLVCPPDDPAAMADALAALAGDPARRRDLGCAARETAERRHSWEAVAGRILAIARNAGPAAERAA